MDTTSPRFSLDEKKITKAARLVRKGHKRTSVWKYLSISRETWRNWLNAGNPDHELIDPNEAQQALKVKLWKRVTNAERLIFEEALDSVTSAFKGYKTTERKVVTVVKGRSSREPTEESPITLWPPEEADDEVMQSYLIEQTITEVTKETRDWRAALEFAKARGVLFEDEGKVEDTQITLVLEGMPRPPMPPPDNKGDEQS